MKPEILAINPIMVLPFILLLTAIALAPFFFSEWWGKHYTKVAFALAGVVVL